MRSGMHPIWAAGESAEGWTRNTGHTKRPARRRGRGKSKREKVRGMVKQGANRRQRRTAVATSSTRALRGLI